MELQEVVQGLAEVVGRVKPRRAVVDSISVVRLLAGGPGAVTRPKEGAEDDAATGAAELAALGVGPAGDYVQGLDTERRLELRDQCASLLPRQGPVDVTASAWATIGRTP